MLQQTDELNKVDPAAAELALIPDYDYSAADFCTPEPYEKLYELRGSPFVYELAKTKMEANAKAVGFKSFRGTLQKFNKAQLDAKRRNLIPNQTEFEDQVMELTCGTWEATDWGIFRDTPNGGRECACAHPIMPIERLVNIDTGEVKLKLYFKRSGRDKKWNTTIVDKSTVSTARNITALASQGISVTSNSASVLVDYINDMENLNYDVIPEKQSIGRLGYIPGEGFSPFVEGLVFDGDATFRNLYNVVSGHGSEVVWYKTALECRKMSVTARILLAASFASPILSLVGSLPFFVHLWGVDSGTGKTVALMLAASVWGNPALGSYIQTFNATQVGQEKTAAFLNHLPYCMDELQLTKDSKGKSSFDVYQLAQGVGRTRGKRNGGVELTPTWSCCFLTTGESPLTNTLPKYADIPEVYTFPQPVGSIGLVPIRVPVENCVDGGKDAVSVYAAAAGLVHNINWNEAQLNGEFELGKSKIIASSDMFKRGKDGKMSIQDDVFVGIDADPDTQGITIFSPALREASYLARKQDYLRSVENIIGLKRGLLSEVEAVERTAKEITSSEGDYSLTITDFQGVWEHALWEALRVCGVLGQMYRIPGANEVAQEQVVISWGNGVLYDEEKTRVRMLGEVQAGLLQPERYLGHVYNLPCDTSAQRAKIRRDYMPEVADEPEEDE